MSALGLFGVRLDMTEALGTAITLSADDDAWDLAPNEARELSDWLTRAADFADPEGAE